MKRTALALLVPALVLAASNTYGQEWPSFRGPQGSGVSSTARPPVNWNVASSTNVAWRTPIAGLGHSSPIVWGDRIYLTTAVSTAPASQQVAVGDVDRAGIDPAKDVVPHEWRLLALDRASGKVIWSRAVHKGVPRVRRHVKSTHASATPTTNGKVVVALFGSEGLFAFDVNGTELWRKDLGVLSVGLANDPTYEWGPASSPVIHDNVVVVQNDRYRDSFVIAFDLTSGKELWRSGRDELPAWTTPLIHSGGAAPMVVTNSPRFIRGHDLASGRERWRLQDPGGEVKVSTPIAAGDLTIVTGGYPSGGRPIYAIRIGDGSIAWRHERGSPYTSTPLAHDGVLYIVTDNGIFSAYQIADGTRVYQQRLPSKGSGFSASPVLAAGRIYLTSEDGEVFVVRAGPKFELLATNNMNEVCMATPAFAGDLLLIRTKTQLYALRGN